MGGGDICAPSVSACEVSLLDYSFKVSDHGNFWTTIFTVEKQEENLLQLKSVTKEFTLSVTFSLQDNLLKREYKIVNTTQHKLPFTFADHLLLPIGKVEIPGVKKMRLEWSYNNLLGKKNDEINWPLFRSGVFADKLFVNINQFVKYQTKDLALTFSSPDLPYVGYWETSGGWNNSYNLGLELTNTDRDNLSEAVKENKVWWIEPKQSKKWSINLEIN